MGREAGLALCPVLPRRRKAIRPFRVGEARWSGRRQVERRAGGWESEGFAAGGRSGWEVVTASGRGAGLRLVTR